MFSFRQLAVLVYSDASYLCKIERGKRVPPAWLVKNLDAALAADGRLIALHTPPARNKIDKRRELLADHWWKDPELQRRLLLLIAMMGFATPAMEIEQLRRSLLAAAGEVDLAEWDGKIWDHGRLFNATPPELMFDRLVKDLIIAQGQYGQLHSEAARRDLNRVVAHLSSLLAETMAAQGDVTSVACGTRQRGVLRIGQATRRCGHGCAAGRSSRGYMRTGHLASYSTSPTRPLISCARQGRGSFR